MDSIFKNHLFCIPYTPYGFNLLFYHITASVLYGKYFNSNFTGYYNQTLKINKKLFFLRFTALYQILYSPTQQHSLQVYV